MFSRACQHRSTLLLLLLQLLLSSQLCELAAQLPAEEQAASLLAATRVQDCP
jgi:hypothetical protein